MAEDQMAEFKSTRAKVDPVSGNEVPTGSLPVEVRDDIDAKLSEGEYVVPADVVRYYGVKFFEDLRNQAKQGWQDMEQGGRIGGEPVGMEMGGDDLPFDLEELQMMDDGQPEEMNAGGYIQGYYGGNYVPPSMPDQGAVAGLQGEFPTSFVGSSMGNNEEYKTYQNAEGMTITIRFINGKPVTPIPEGYTEANAAQETVAPEQRITQDSGNDDTPPPQPKPATDWTSKEVGADKFNEAIDSMYSPVGKGAVALAGAINPILGIAGTLATRHQEKTMLNALNARIEAGEKDLIASRDKLLSYVDKDKDGDPDNFVQRSGIFGGAKDMYSNLKDTSGSFDKEGKQIGDSKVTFGDTWLGDLLGFDGKAGVQGAGLKESLGGARRDFSSGSSSSDKSGSGSTSTKSSSDKETKTSSNQSFSEAFKSARAEQGAGGTFSWNGKDYTTDYA